MSGCGCKGQKSEPVKINKGGVITTNEHKEISLPRIEDVTRVKDYLRARTKTEEERQFFAQFVLNNFGEVLGSYCDHVCMERQVKRLHELELKLLS